MLIILSLTLPDKSNTSLQMCLNKNVVTVNQNLFFRQIIESKFYSCLEFFTHPSVTYDI